MTNDEINAAREYFYLNRWCERAGVNYHTVKGALKFDRDSEYHTSKPEWRSALQFQLRKDVEHLAEIAGLEVKEAKKGRRAARSATCRSRSERSSTAPDRK